LLSSKVRSPLHKTISSWTSGTGQYSASHIVFNPPPAADQPVVGWTTAGRLIAARQKQDKKRDLPDLMCLELPNVL